MRLLLCIVGCFAMSRFAPCWAYEPDGHQTIEAVADRPIAGTNAEGQFRALHGDLSLGTAVAAAPPHATLAADPVPTPAPAPAARSRVPGPAPAATAAAPVFDVANATKLGDENGYGYLQAPAWVWFGANGAFRSRHFAAGPVMLSRDVFGGDPAPGVLKAGYVLDAAAVKPTPTATGAQLLKGAAPTDADGVFFPGTQLLPDPAMPAAPFGNAMPILTRRARVVPPGFAPSPRNGVRVAPSPIAAGSPLITFPGSAIKNSIPDIARGFFDIWADGAFFFGSRKFRSWAAGGHGGGNEVDVIEVDIDTMTARRCFPDVATPVLMDKDHGDYAPLPPLPQAIHNYGTQVATTDPLQGGRDMLFKLGAGTGDATIFDPDGSGWVERLQRINDNTTGALAVGDPKRGFVWLQVTGPSNLLYHYDLALRRVFSHGAGGTPESWKGGPGGLTDDDFLWQIVPGTNPDNSAANDHAWLSLTSIAGVLANPGLGRTFVRIPIWNIPSNFAADYDGKRRRWIIHAADPLNPSQGRWWALARDTLVLTDLARGGQAPAQNGTWGRMRIDPERDVAITVASEALDFYGLQLHGH